MSQSYYEICLFDESLTFWSHDKTCSTAILLRRATCRCSMLHPYG